MTEVTQHETGAESSRDDDASIGETFVRGGRRRRGQAAGALPSRPPAASDQGRRESLPEQHEPSDYAGRTDRVAYSQEDHPQQYRGGGNDRSTLAVVDRGESYYEQQPVSGEGPQSLTNRSVTVTIYPSSSLVKRIESYQDKRKRDLNVKTYENGRVMLDALLATEEGLVQSVADRVRPQRPKTSRFTAMAPAKPATERNRPAWNFSCHPANVGELDGLVDEVKRTHGVTTNRSELCCIALDLFLPKRGYQRNRKQDEGVEEQADN